MVVDSDAEALDAIKRFLDYLPSHHNEAPPDAPVPAGSGADMDKVFSILPESRTQVYDMRRIVKAVVDKDTMFELKPRFGKSALTALAPDKSLALLKSRGMVVTEFSPSEKARVVAKLKPVYDKNVPAIGSEAVNVVMDALKKARGG